MSAECSHVKLVRLVCFGEQQWLTHLGTGELVKVFGATTGLSLKGPWVLKFTDAGWGYIVGAASDPEDAAVQWVNDVFTLSMHVCWQEGGRMCDNKRYILDRRTGKSTWLSDLMPLVTARCFSAGTGALRFACEAYFHEVPKTPGGNIIWLCLPWVVEFMYGKQLLNNMIARYAPSWINHISDLGCPAAGDHIRASAQARAANRRANPDVVNFCGEQEWTVSVFGLLMLCSFITASCKYSKVLESGGKKHSELLMQLILCKTLPVCGSTLVWTTFYGANVPIADASVSLAVMLAGSGHTWLLGAVFPDATADKWPLAQVLAALASDTLYGRRTGGRKAFIKQLLCDLAQFLADAVECTRSHSMWAETSPLALGVLPSASQRPRRLPSGFRQAVASTVAEQPSLRKPQQLLACVKALTDTGAMQPGLGSHALQPQSGANMAKHTVYQYLLAGRELGSRTRHASLALDATRVSGDEVMSLAFFSCDQKEAMWLPAQVPLGLLWRCTLARHFGCA